MHLCRRKRQPREIAGAYEHQGEINEGEKSERYGGEPYQPHPGTQCHRCGCSLPGLTGFTADRCGGTGRAHHNKTRLAASGAIVPAYSQLTTGLRTGKTLSLRAITRRGLLARCASDPPITEPHTQRLRTNWPQRPANLSVECRALQAKAQTARVLTACKAPRAKPHRSSAR